MWPSLPDSWPRQCPETLSTLPTSSRTCRWVPFRVLPLLFFLLALTSGRQSWAVLTGLSLAVAYFGRVTIVMDLPVYLALTAWAYSKKLPGSPVRMAATALTLAASAPVLESLLYRLTTGDWLYRVRALLAERTDPANLELIARSTAGGNSFTDPLFVLVASHELGLLFISAVGVAVWMLARKRNSGLAVPLALWFLIGLVWVGYGTTVPTDWTTLQRDPRYWLGLSFPACLLVATALAAVSRRLRFAGLALLLTTGVLACFMDRASTITDPHKAWLASEITADSTLHPLEYLGARWEQNFKLPVDYFCGETEKYSCNAGLPGTSVRSIYEANRVVLSPTRAAKLHHELTAAGYREVRRFVASDPGPRRAVLRLLRFLPGQESRLEKSARSRRAGGSRASREHSLRRRLLSGLLG